MYLHKDKEALKKIIEAIVKVHYIASKISMDDLHKIFDKYGIA